MPNVSPTRILSGTALGAASYVVSALAYLFFSLYFIRVHGTASYGTFSILLNTVSALTLFGNYHGSIVSFSVTSDRVEYRRFRMVVIAYSLAAAAVATIIFYLVGRLSTWLSPLVFSSFFFLVYSGLPSSTIMSTPANFLLNIIRAIYQIVIISVFWPLFVESRNVSFSFTLALTVASAVNAFLLTILSRRTFVNRSNSKVVRPSILVAALVGNSAMMATLLVDKFALQYLTPGTADERGVFLLYIDLIGRLSNIFNVLLPTLTFLLLQSLSNGGNAVNALSISIFITLIVGAIAFVGGQWGIPIFYDISLKNLMVLPFAMAAYITFYGVSSAVLAFCNSTGQIWYLGAHYWAMFAVTILAIATPSLILSRALTVNDLAIAVASGQAVALVSAPVLLSRHFMAKREKKDRS